MARNSTERLGGEYDWNREHPLFTAHAKQESTQLSRASTNVELR